MQRCAQSERMEKSSDIHCQTLLEDAALRTPVTLRRVRDASAVQDALQDLESTMYNLSRNPDTVNYIYKAQLSFWPDAKLKHDAEEGMRKALTKRLRNGDHTLSRQMKTDKALVTSRAISAQRPIKK